MPISDIISKIKAKTGLDEKAIEAKIAEKLKNLDSLVSKEGAAHIVAHELDVQLFEQLNKSEQKISELLIGMRNATITGKVTRTFDPRTFERNGRKGIVGSFIVADETGNVRAVLWDERANWIRDGKLTEGQVVTIKNALVKESRDQNKEIHLNLRSILVLDVEKDIDVQVSKRGDVQEGKIGELQAGSTAKTYGTIVRLFPPYFYEVCPECGKKAQTSDAGAICKDHGDIQVKSAVVFSFIIDDGSGHIRCVFFKESAERVMGMGTKEAQDLAENELLLVEKLNDKLLGKEVQVEGFLKDNRAFDRKELIVNSIELEPNPKIIAMRLMEDAKKES